MTSSAAPLTDRARNTTPGWRAHRLDDRPSPAAGEVDVQQHDVRGCAPDALDGRLDVDGLADDLHRHVAVGQLGAPDRNRRWSSTRNTRIGPEAGRGRPGGGVAGESGPVVTPASSGALAEPPRR